MWGQSIVILLDLRQVTRARNAPEMVFGFRLVSKLIFCSLQFFENDTQRIILRRNDHTLDV